MNFAATIATLEAALRQPLPGRQAQLLMAPQPRQSPADFPPFQTREAAGLLLLFPIEDETHVVLTERAHTLERHRGQVSLPGGGIDAGETYEEAALREAHEEIGLAPGTARPIGALTPIDIPVSGFRLHPIVAATDRRPALVPSDHEVARILETPLATLLDSTRIVRRSVVRNGQTFLFPAFPAAGDTEIWGATAMVLAELLTMFGWKGPQ